MQKEIIDGISFIKSSGYRYKIIKSINSELKMPSEISKETNIRLNHVSACLKDLKEKGLIECLNNDTKKGKLYRLTKLGKDVISKLS